MIVLAAMLVAPNALADDASTVWGRARRPDLVANEKMLRQVDELGKGGDSGADVRGLRMNEAKRQLEAAGGERSADVRVRMKYADVLHVLEDYAGCARAYERGLALLPDAPTAAQANADLAICYARLGRHVDEMRARTARRSSSRRDPRAARRSSRTAPRRSWRSAISTPPSVATASR